MSKTRIAKLKGFSNIIHGRDLSDIFEEGHVYSVREISGQFIIDDLGEYACSDQHHKSVSDYILTGECLYTQKEYDNL